MAVLIAVALLGCGRPSADRNNWDTRPGCETITYEQCEYLHCGEGQTGMLTHKGNCRNAIHPENDTRSLDDVRAARNEAWHNERNR